VGSASPKEHLRLARRDVHRQHLLDAAERVFAERGYEGTRMQDVAAESGLSLATVYDLIRSKEDLYADIHRVRGRALLEQAMAASVGATSALDALLRGVGAYVEFLAGHPDYLRIELRESQPWALSPRFISEEQAAQWHTGLHLAIAAFRAAIDEGSVIGEDPEILARLMIAAHQVYLGAWIEAGRVEPAAALIRRMQLHVRRAFGC
jgi:AcrR family transcriptional regulator